MRSYRVLFALLFAAALVGCADGPASEDASVAGAASGSGDHPPPVKAAAAGPAVPYRVEGACPFECCTYGTWTAEQPLAVYATAGDTSAVAFTIPPGASFEADTGYVAVTQSGVVVVERPVEVYRSYDSSRPVAPGDTLYLLDYVGEGVLNAWLADSVYQIEAAMPNGPAYRTLREPEQTWWTHVRLSDGREGRLWMDEHQGTLRGYDGCA